MNDKKRKTAHQLLRSLHRDVGYFLFGLVVVYSLSGVTLIYRVTDFLKHDVTREFKIDPGLEDSALGGALRQRDFSVTRTEGDMVYFENGSYNRSTGDAEVVVKELIFPFNYLTQFHTVSSNDALHWFNTIFGILLLFMGISSWWMFKPGSKLFRRGLVLASAGIVFAVILLILKFR